MDLDKYVGHLIILMAQGLRSIDTLWDTEGFTVQYPGKEQGLPHYRFMALYQKLAYDPITLSHLLNTSLSSTVTPRSSITVDETRRKRKTRGGLFIVHNPKKPDKYALEGISIAASCGLLYYISNPFLHPKPTATREVLAALDGYLPTWARPHLVADRRFGSLLLARELQSRGIPFTLNCKRNTPSTIFKDQLCKEPQRSGPSFAKVDGMVAVTLKVEHTYCLLTSAFSIQPAPRHILLGERAGPFDLYRHNNRNIDRFNQLLQSYHNPHRHGFDLPSWLDQVIAICLTNAYLLSGIAGIGSAGHYEFLMSISEALLTGH